MDSYSQNRDTFLPVSRQDMEARGWYYCDFLVVTGDAYVDHPSFGASVISRVLEKDGFRVAILAQPDWNNIDELLAFGKPRYGVMITSGNVDSMVANYTVARRKRTEDAYSPGGKAGRRPDRAVTVYCNMARRAFGDIPVIIGGIEASLRRFAHYDYWDDSLRRGILEDSGADLLIYGMGEKAVSQIAKRLKKGAKIKDITDIRGTCYMTREPSCDFEAVMLPSFEEISKSKKEYARAAFMEQNEQDYIRGKALLQKSGNRYLVQNPPMAPLTMEEFDGVYELPYTYGVHPDYEKEGGVPAIEEVRFSVTHNRGCFGTCTFCALALHQGRTITARSHDSVIKEAQRMISFPDFKGYIHDVGGPTANFRKPACQKQLKSGTCAHRACLYPTPCPNLDTDHSDYLELLTKLRELPGVKKVFIRSGIRYDYLMCDKNDDFFEALVRYHISGQLRVAPEHISSRVLFYMGKPFFDVYDRFIDKFFRINKKVGLKQYPVPYLMSSHPGSNLDDAIELAQYLRKNKITPQQVQDFYPTPGTLATAMYYSGYDPRTLKPVFVAKTSEEKKLQRALLQAHIPENRYAVIEALKKTGREDLIGSAPGCIITANARDKAWSGKKPDGKTEGGKKEGGKAPAKASAKNRKPETQKNNGKKPASQKKSSLKPENSKPNGKKPQQKGNSRPQKGKVKGR